jgi:2,3-dihydroxybenzoate decarboxylase
LDLGEDLQPDARPSAIIKRHFAITTSGVCDPGPLAEAIGALGEDNVMFSVDYPYEDSQIANPHRSARKCAPRSARATPNGF